MKRHKWNGSNSFNRIRSNTDGRSSMAVACVKCGCVKEYVDGRPTYFIDDTVSETAPPCDERLLTNDRNDAVSDTTGDDSKENDH